MQPAAGMLLVYTADDSNVHSVQEVSRLQAAPIMRLLAKPPGAYPKTQALHYTRESF